MITRGDAYSTFCLGQGYGLTRATATSMSVQPGLGVIKVLRYVVS